MIKAIIFDCYGVLYPDTYWTMVNEFLGDNLQDPKTNEALHDLIRQVDLGKISRDDLWVQFAALVGVEVGHIYERLKEFGGLDKRLLNFIDDNKSRYKFGIISNVGHGFLERMFTQRRAESYFDSIVLSSDVGFVKPDPKIYQIAAEQLGCLPVECIFVDDLEKNVKGAIDVGMNSFRYTSFNSFQKEVKKILSSS